MLTIISSDDADVSIKFIEEKPVAVQMPQKVEIEVESINSSGQYVLNKITITNNDVFRAVLTNGRLVKGNYQFS